MGHVKDGTELGRASNKGKEEGSILQGGGEERLREGKRERT